MLSKQILRKKFNVVTVTSTKEIREKIRNDAIEKKKKKSFFIYGDK